MTEGVRVSARDVAPEAKEAVVPKPALVRPLPWFRSIKDNPEAAFAFYRDVRETQSLASRVREETEITNEWLGRAPTLAALREFHEERGLFFDWVADACEAEFLPLVDAEVDAVCRLVVADLRRERPSDKMPSREEDARELRRVLRTLNTDDFAERFSAEALAPYEEFVDRDAKGRRWFERMPSAGLSIEDRRALHIAYLLSPPQEEPSREELLALARWVSPMVALVDSFDRLIDQQITQRVTHAMRVAMVGKPFE